MNDLQISLKAARVNADLTQNEAAKKINVGTSTISSWEKGVSQPKIEQAQRISEIYNVPLDCISFSKKSR